MIYDLYANRVYANVTLIWYTRTRPGTRVRFDVHGSDSITRDVTRDFSLDLDQRFRAYYIAAHTRL